MDPTRRLLLAILLALLVLWGGWQLYAGWGLVTMNVQDAPIGKVLSAISRQGGIEIVSDLAPETKVSLQVKRMPPVEALDIVAVRTDASWRLAYLGAPDQAALNAALAGFRAGQEAPGWTSSGGGGFTLVEPESGEAFDLREVRWNPSSGGPLPDILQEAAEKTGVLLAAPTNWLPEVARPQPGPISAVAPRLFRQAGGVSREVFLLRGRGGSDEEAAGGWRGGRWIGSAPERPDTGARGGGWIGRVMGDPERVAERVEAQIALLPAAEQPRARENFATMREFWQSVRDLPEDQRREKAREFFTRPEVAEAMENRRVSRWAKMTPEQRIARTKSYWERKAAAQNRNAP
jgi:hypothetical protein